MKIAHEIVTVRTKHPFIIARGGSSDHRTVFVRVTDTDGAEGWGEAAPSKFYGETVETVVATLERLDAALEGADAWSLEAVESEMNRIIRFNAAAKAAVSAALHDLAGKRLGITVARMLGLDGMPMPHSSFTIGIPETMADLRQRVEEAAEYPIIKVKLGSDRDVEIIRTVRLAAPDKVLRVDANAAWTAKHALRMVEILLEYEIDLLDQPLPGAAAPGARAGGTALRPRARAAADHRRRELPRGGRHSEARRRRRRHQHQARQVRRHPRSIEDDRDGPRARHAGHGRLHDRDEPR